ncbi:hypothetical protein AURDEDRAFT_162810 [Auricularia subglabra TFB-10046 SS5]|nr:hypothetical protein AURDEDRAFT_162810 [Auricularia subglabra TFB-10046 SS5]
MSAICRLPDDLLSCVFDELSVTQLVQASHVCQHWRLIAHNHETFWGTAAIYKYLDSPVLDFFLARLAQAQIGHRPVNVTVWPNLGRPKTRDQLAIIEARIIPAIASALSHIASLHVEVPTTLSEPMFNALRQPAPELRSFNITNWQSFAHVCIPPDVFACYAPRLTHLSLGHSVDLPGQPVAAFQSVQSLTFLARSSIAALANIFEWFPNLRQLDTCARELTTDVLSLLSTQHFLRLSRLESLGLHVSSLTNMQRLGNPGDLIAQTRALRLNLVPIERSMHPPPLTVESARLLLPQSSQELYCWLEFDGTLLAFPEASSGTVFSRRTNGLLTFESSPIFARQVTAYRGLVALSIDIDIWEPVLQLTDTLPALEVLVIALKSQLPRKKTLVQPIPSSRLRTIVFHDRYPPEERWRQECALVTCRGIDEFLRAAFVVDDWASLQVLLIDVRLYGAATVSGTKISGVRVTSTKECAALGPHVAMLLDNVHTFRRV